MNSRLNLTTPKSDNRSCQDSQIVDSFDIYTIIYLCSNYKLIGLSYSYRYELIYLMAGLMIFGIDDMIKLSFGFESRLISSRSWIESRLHADSCFSVFSILPHGDLRTPRGGFDIKIFLTAVSNLFSLGFVS